THLTCTHSLHDALPIFNLVVGTNTINTVVTAQNGVTNTYVIVVTRAPSANAALANLVLSSGTLNPGFAASTASYSASVPNAVNRSEEHTSELQSRGHLV